MQFPKRQAKKRNLQGCFQQSLLYVPDSPAMSNRTAAGTRSPKDKLFSISLLPLALPCLLTWAHLTVPSSCIMIMAKSSTQPCTLNRCRSHLPSDPFHLPWNVASIHGNKSIDCHSSAISEELPRPLVVLFLGLRKTYRLRTRDHFGPVIMKYFLSSLGLGWILKA